MATITYNNQTTEVDVDKLATCTCNGKLMESDMVITADTFLVMTYNDGEQHIEDGKTATLKCGGCVAQSDITVDTHYCKIVVCQSDGTTILEKFLATPNVTVKVAEENGSDGVVLQFTFGGSDRVDHSNTYLEIYDDGTKLMLGGVTVDENYYRPQYVEGDSFALAGHKVHKIYLHGDRAGYSTRIWVVGAPWVDGKDYPIYDVTTWADFVNNSLYNVDGFQITEGHIYTSDGGKVLYDADGVMVNSTDLLVQDAEYTFKAV